MNKITKEYLVRLIDVLNYLTECFRQFERGDVDNTLEDIQANWQTLSERTYLVDFRKFEDLSHDMFMSAALQGDTPANPDLRMACLEIGFLMRQISVAMQSKPDWKSDEVMETLRLESLSDDDYFAEVEKWPNENNSTPT